MMNRPLRTKNIDRFIYDLETLDKQGFVEYGPVDEFRKEIEAETGYPIDRTHFFKMIKEEMAYRYVEIREMLIDMQCAVAPGHAMGTPTDWVCGWSDAIYIIKGFYNDRTQTSLNSEDYKAQSD